MPAALAVGLRVRMCERGTHNTKKAVRALLFFRSRRDRVALHEELLVELFGRQVVREVKGAQEPTHAADRHVLGELEDLLEAVGLRSRQSVRVLAAAGRRRGSGGGAKDSQRSRGTTGRSRGSTMRSQWQPDSFPARTSSAFLASFKASSCPQSSRMPSPIRPAARHCTVYFGAGLTLLGLCTGAT